MLAKQFWQKAVTEGVSDDDVGSAVTLGYQLGFDKDDNLRRLLTRMGELAQKGRGGVMDAKQ